MPSLWLVFTTGLIAGGVSCVAVQGGLLATALYRRAGESKSIRAGVLGVGSFLGAKFVSHVILGALLGLLGAAVQPSITARAIMQAVAAMYMLGVAGAMLDVHPIFRYFILQPPRFLSRWVRHTSKSESLFTPAVLGAATIFIPCGTTQAMMVLAMGTGNAVWGAAVLGAFVLGTSPIFLGLGTVLAKLGDVMRGRFNKFAAVAVAGMAIWSLTGVSALLGVPVTNVARAAYCTVTFCREEVAGVAAEKVTVEILPDGYRASSLVLKAGAKVSLNLKNANSRGCSQVFTIPRLGVNEVVPLGTEKEIEIEVPKGLASLSYTCGMGMYGGQFTVVN